VFQDTSSLFFSPGVFASIGCAPQVLHLLLPAPHQGLVLGDLELLAVDDAGPLGPWPVPVVGVLLHVQLGELRLLLVELLLGLDGHRLPARTQDLRDAGVVQVGAGLQDLPPFVLGPDHEGVHRPLDVVLALGGLHPLLPLWTLEETWSRS